MQSFLGAILLRPANVRCVPKALVPFKVMNDCYPEAAVHFQSGNCQSVPKGALQFEYFIGWRPTLKA